MGKSSIPAPRPPAHLGQCREGKTHFYAAFRVRYRWAVSLGKPDPPRRPSDSMVGREGVAAAALALRWGNYLAVLLDRDKPVWSRRQARVG